MKKDDRIGRFERFKLRYRPTDRQTDGHDLLQKCEDALKNKAKKANKVRRVDRQTNALPDRPTDRPTDGYSQL